MLTRIMGFVSLEVLAVGANKSKNSVKNEDRAQNTPGSSGQGKHISLGQPHQHAQGHVDDGHGQRKVLHKPLGRIPIQALLSSWTIQHRWQKEEVLSVERKNTSFPFAQPIYFPRKDEKYWLQKKPKISRYNVYRLIFGYI
ncbi:hypothetical protein [Hymenobacter lucidus]|uniref:Secreted protein n=1 Tax=Hymenobacter lucidus TaxID=2880930 RepID=A0ABS8ATC4_9BACT|nr:hypothetical protein [Hymenobacter lucidus]MCB2409467.1 hypothetical protein [Hymenobacter lucidus]